MLLSEYQSNAVRTLKPMTLHDQIPHLVTGLAAEAGEVSGLLQHIYLQRDTLVSDWVEEMGDVLWHLAALCDTLNLSLEDVAAANLAKLQKRHGREFSLSHYQHESSEAAS